MRLASSGVRVDSIGSWLLSPSLMLSYATQVQVGLEMDLERSEKNRC